MDREYSVGRVFWAEFFTRVFYGVGAVSWSQDQPKGTEHDTLSLGRIMFLGSLAEARLYVLLPTA